MSLCRGKLEPPKAHIFVTPANPSAVLLTTATAENGGVTAAELDGSPEPNLDMAFESVATLPDTATFTVMRWGGTNRVAQVQGSGEARKLVLPIDLSQAFCRKDAQEQDVPCGIGKYVVKQVTAHRWVDSGYAS